MDKPKSLIDTHTHFMPIEFLKRAEADPDRYFAEVREAEDGYYIKTRFWSLSEFMEYGPFQPVHYDWDTRVQHMDEAGVSTQVLTTVQSLNYNWAEEDLALEVAALANDEMARAADLHPGRFKGLASVPFQHVEASITELRRAVRDLDMRGVQILSNVDGSNFDGPEYRPFFKEVQELDVPIFVHPYGTLNADRLRENFLVNVVGWPSEQAVAMGSLLLSGLFDEFPGLRFHVAHGGGTFLFVIARIAKGVSVIPGLAEKLDRDVMDYLEHIWVDTILHNDAALRFAYEILGPGKLMFGTDWPFWMQDLHMLERLQAIEGIPADEMEAIFATTASELYGVGTGNA